MKKAVILLFLLLTYLSFSKGIKLIDIKNSLSTLQVQESIEVLKGEFKTNEMLIYLSGVDTLLINSIDSTLLKDNYVQFQYSIFCCDKKHNTWISIFVGNKQVVQKQIDGFNPFKYFDIKKKFYKVSEFEPFGTNEYVMLDWFEKDEAAIYYKNQFITYLDEKTPNEFFIKGYVDKRINEETRNFRNIFFPLMKKLIKDEVLGKQLKNEKIVWQD